MNGTSPRLLKVIPLIIVLLTTLACPAFSEDIQMLIKRAKGGNPDDQCSLGNLYNQGKGVPQDYAEAAKWYSKAAEQGHSSAQSMLGYHYALGHGVPRDYLLAYFWFSLSASRSKDDFEYGMTAGSRDEAAKKLTPEQLMKAQQMTRDWEAKHPRK